MLRSAQHDKKGKHASFSMTKPKVSFRASARNPVWMLHFVQHDKTESVIPSVGKESTVLALPKQVSLP